MKYTQYILKRKIEDVFIYSFICLGRIIAWLRPLKKEYKVFFFFPCYHTGGAEKVHVQIAEAVGSADCIIYFTRKSKDNTFLKSFENTRCDIKDISPFTDNKWLFFLNLLFRGVVAGRINKQKGRPIVFNGQSNFAYKISPWIQKEIVQIELIHALNTFSFIRIPFIHHYAKCLTVSQQIVDRHVQVYEKIGVPELLLARFSFIETRIQLPGNIAEKDYYYSPLRLLYVGRGTEEKRVHIVAEIAEKLFSGKLPVEVHFAGDVKDAIPEKLHKYCHFHGNVNNEEELNSLYDRCHILFVTSVTESGPLVIMEAMARGLAIVTTDVGFVSAYVLNDINGFKVSAHLREEEIVTAMSEYVKLVYYDRNKLAEIGRNNIKTAYSHFDVESFKSSYKSLFAACVKHINPTIPF